MSMRGNPTVNLGGMPADPDLATGQATPADGGFAPAVAGSSVVAAIQPWMKRMLMPRKDRLPDLIRERATQDKRKNDADFMAGKVEEIQQAQQDLAGAQSQMQGITGQFQNMAPPKMAQAGERTVGEGLAGLVGGVAGGDFGASQQASLMVAQNRHQVDYANEGNLYTQRREALQMEFEQAKSQHNEAAHRLAQAMQSRDAAKIQFAQDDYEFSMKRADFLEKEAAKVEFEEKKQQGRVAIQQLKGVQQDERMKAEVTKEYDFMVNVLNLSPEQAVWNLQQKYDNQAAQTKVMNARAADIPKRLQLDWWKAKDSRAQWQTASDIARERLAQDGLQFDEEMGFKRYKQYVDEELDKLKLESSVAPDEKTRVEGIRKHEATMRETRQVRAALVSTLSNLNAKIKDGTATEADLAEQAKIEKQLISANGMIKEQSSQYKDMVDRHVELKKGESAEKQKAASALEAAKKKVNQGKPQYQVSQEDWDRYAPKRKQIMDLETKAFVTFGKFKTGKTNARMIQDTNTPSLHSYGAALDLHGDRLQDKANWAIRQPGVQVVIYNRQIWTPHRGWRKKTTGDPHTDHVHVDYGR